MRQNKGAIHLAVIVVIASIAVLAVLYLRTISETPDPPAPRLMSSPPLQQNAYPIVKESTKPTTNDTWIIPDLPGEYTWQARNTNTTEIENYKMTWLSLQDNSYGKIPFNLKL